MADFFRRGIGWKLQKQYIRFFGGLVNVLATHRVNSVRKGRPFEGKDLDQLFLDDRMSLSDPIDQVKYIALRILRMLDYLGGQNDFQYTLAYGTLLGAVRHGGFIPWDDDIDTMMTKSDLNKLIECSNQLPDSLVLFRMSKNFWKLMDRYSTISKDGKRGVAVDIFVLENGVDDPQEAFYSFINVHKVAYQNLSKQDFYPLKRIKFEKDDKFNAPANPDAILKSIYGDYQQLPPVEQRVSPHLRSAMDIRPITATPIHPPQ